ncbi:unnamed protein product [Schistosoma spindalis]|nr:unnamed protein product [Schistosoma spindale]
MVHFQQNLTEMKYLADRHIQNSLEGISFHFHSLTYLLLLPPMEHREPTSILQPTLSWAFLSTSVQFLFILFMSVSISRRNVFFGLPLLLCF